MQEVILYGITKEPIHCFYGDRMEISECVGGYGRDMFPCADGKYLGNHCVTTVVDTKSLPIHTILLNSVDYWGERHRTERRIAFTPELIKEIGGNPVELNMKVNNLLIEGDKLREKLKLREAMLLQIKSNLSTASFWERLKWVFTGVKVSDKESL